MAAHADTSHGGRLYWGTWLTLLALTLVMIVVDGLSMPRSVFLSVVLSAMFVKATLIGAHFMHLRFERLSLAAMVVGDGEGKGSPGD